MNSVQNFGSMALEKEDTIEQSVTVEEASAEHQLDPTSGLSQDVGAIQTANPAFRKPQLAYRGRGRQRASRKKKQKVEDSPDNSIEYNLRSKKNRSVDENKSDVV